jgi:hypothetical protein
MFSSTRRKLVALGGAALAHVNDAFGNVSGGKCVLGDVEADTGEPCDAVSSVDGTAGGRDAGASRGNVNQWWSHDTPSTIGGKITCAKIQNLGGVFFGNSPEARPTVS